MDTAIVPARALSWSATARGPANHRRGKHAVHQGGHHVDSRDAPTSSTATLNETIGELNASRLHRLHRAVAVAQASRRERGVGHVDPAKDAGSYPTNLGQLVCFGTPLTTSARHCTCGATYLDRRRAWSLSVVGVTVGRPLGLC